MRAILKISAFITTMVFFSASPAAAKAGDKAWAQCVWSNASDSASAWLNLPLPNWQTKYDDRSILLGHRIIALCDDSVPDPLRPNRMPNWKALASALKSTKPKTPPALQSNEAVMLCTYSTSVDNHMQTYLYEFLRRVDGKDRISFQQYYAHDQGMALKLPQDLRMVPDSKQEVIRLCKIISGSGDLTGV
jgi:hypothetical protein